MRRRWPRPVLLCALASLASLGMLIRSLSTMDAVDYVSATQEKRLYRLMSWDGRICYLVTDIPSHAQGSYSRRWYLYSLSAHDVESSNYPDEDAWLGFEATARDWAVGGRFVRVERISIPLALPFTLFAIPPARAWWSRRRRRFPPGHCQACGYDLRETPERCPECGNPAEKSA
jgi:hypothetical protein